MKAAKLNLAIAFILGVFYSPFLLAQSGISGNPNTDTTFNNAQIAIKKTLPNRLSINLFEFTIYNDIAVEYERKIDNEGMFGLMLMASYSLPMQKHIEYEYENLYNAGAGLMFYPLGQGKWKYFAGTRLIIGKAAYANYLWVSRHFDPTYYYVEDRYLYGKAYIDNGILMSQAGVYYFSMVLSFGTKYSFHTFIDGIKPSVALSINMGVRF